jgi:hypothetical protein
MYLNSSFINIGHPKIYRIGCPYPRHGLKIWQKKDSFAPYFFSFSIPVPLYFFSKMCPCFFYIFKAK